MCSKEVKNYASALPLLFFLYQQFNLQTLNPCQVWCMDRLYSHPSSLTIMTSTSLHLRFESMHVAFASVFLIWTLGEAICKQDKDVTFQVKLCSAV